MNSSDLSIKSSVNNLFVHNDVDFTQNNIQAAIITAVSRMALCTNIVLPDDVVKVLYSVYNVSDIETVESLIGMSPSFVKSLIGYSVDFMDLSRAMSAYEAQKNQYDDLYSNIKFLAEEKEQNKGR